LFVSGLFYGAASVPDYITWDGALIGE